MLARKKWEDEMTKLSKAVVITKALVRKLTRIPNEETEPPDVQEAESMRGGGSRAQEGPSP